MHNTGLILDAESINDLKTLSIKAENVGFHSVWATELYRTSFQQIASTAQNTTKIRLGTAVSLAFTRSPLITALNSLDIDASSHKNKSFEYNGDYYQINTKGYKRAFKPLRDNIDIYLAGIGTNMIRTSAEIADGYIGHVICS
jgi:alkanesulfonate monooxygenase SsuD/methylene tetrahydromethanopterin reductase-like flavin-dependent oxidoreductase (luciferase family)